MHQVQRNYQKERYNFSTSTIGVIKIRSPFFEGSKISSGSSGISCLVCGAETFPSSDIPLRNLKSFSQNAIESFVKGEWNSGISEAKKLDQVKF